MEKHWGLPRPVKLHKTKRWPPHVCSLSLWRRGGGLARSPCHIVCRGVLQTQPLPGPCAGCGPGSSPDCGIKQQVFRAHMLAASHLVETVIEHKWSQEGGTTCLIMYSTATFTSLRKSETKQVDPHLSKPGSPFCPFPSFVRLAKIARISMTTS